MEKFFKIDKRKIEEALNLIEKQKAHKGMISNEENDIFIIDGAEETFTKILEIFENPEEYEIDIPERELYEIDNFDKKALSEIKKYYKNPFVYVFGHGTVEEERAKSIIEEGLQMKTSHMLESTIPLDYSENSFEQIKNWPHLNSKYIVLIGMQDTRTIIPSLKKHERESQFDYGYLMNRNRIIGYIDVENERFISSPYYEEIQTYDKEYNILPDNPANQRGYNMIYSILCSMQVYQEYGNYIEIDDQRKFDGIRENFFITSFERIQENIEYIKERLKKDGITREAYNDSIKVVIPPVEEVTNFDDIDFSSWSDFETADDWDDEKEDIIQTFEEVESLEHKTEKITNTGGKGSR